MSEQVSLDRLTVRLRHGGSLGTLLAVAALFCAPSGGWAHDGSRVRVQDSTVFDSCWVAAPTVCADVTACPAVTCPEATVARFSVFPLSMIATIVDVRVAHSVLVARIGGLYGP